MCGVRNKNECAYDNLPPFVFFDCPEQVGQGTIFGDDMGWVWLLLFLSQVLLSLFQMSAEDIVLNVEQ